MVGRSGTTPTRMWEDGDYSGYFHDNMILLRTSQDAQATDLLGQWDLSALNFSFESGRPARRNPAHGTLNFASDGTFVIDDLSSMDGLRSDLAGTWQLRGGRQARSLRGWRSSPRLHRHPRRHGQRPSPSVT